MWCFLSNSILISFFIRPDTNFDELIKSLYGDVEKLEKYEDDEITKMNKKNMNNAYAESRKRGIRFQAEQRVSVLLQYVSVNEWYL